MTWQQKGEDRGRWTEYINTETGESSIKEHELKLIWKSCKQNEHYWEIAQDNLREIECKSCKARNTYVLGFHEIIDGVVRERKR